ncbi:hypothetical protein BJ170DRAFT_680159 [Xylariales sp. AK1849]|nr:hypothetical protein BJ170DRAFT_680159 [Xylariales sp. AK1849]
MRSFGIHVVVRWVAWTQVSAKESPIPKSLAIASAQLRRDTIKTCLVSSSEQRQDQTPVVTICYRGFPEAGFSGSSLKSRVLANVIGRAFQWDAAVTAN